MIERAVLLDLNYTLVTNSHQKLAPFARQIEREEYSEDLLGYLRSQFVILITARPAKYRDPTLASIERKTGWRPNEAFFNDQGLPPPASKARHLDGGLLARFGAANLFGIESNPATRRVYGARGIASCTRDEFLADPGRLSHG